MICLAGGARAAVVYAPPEASVDAANELEGIGREIGDRNFASAAQRLDALLAARADQLVGLSEGTLTSVSAWVDQLPSDRRNALGAAYAREFGNMARDALAALHKLRTPAAEELYAVARRYPLTAAAGQALADAGDVALAAGDLAAARAYWEMAARDGFAIGEARAARLAEAKRILDGEAVAAPEDLGEPKRANGAKPRAAGALPFDATWFGEPSNVGLAKFFPAAYGDRVILSSWNGVTMLRTSSGERVWSSPGDRPPPGFSTLRPLATGRGALFAPAVLADVHGRPAVVVVRQPSADGRYVVRGVNATDGKTLWSTATTDPRSDVSYAGLPAVAGRYVYAVVVQRTNASAANLILAALDVMTGSALWQTPLGSVAEQGVQQLGGRKNIRPEPLDVDAFAELSEPAVAGDLVIASPNCGAAIAVGRFDGRVRWVGVYRAGDAPAEGAAGMDPRLLRGRPARMAELGEATVVARLRYRSTPVACGNVVLVMPQDAVSIYAFDRAGGRKLWESDLQTTEAFGIAGASGDMAVLCGSTLTGLDAGGTGKRRWRYVPPRNTPLTGPAVVAGRTVIAPTADGLVQLDVADGKPRVTYDVPSFRDVIRTPGGRAAVNDAGATKAFGAGER